MMLRRPLLVLALALGLVAGPASDSRAAAAAKREYRLPVGLADAAAMPESIDVDERGNAYFTGATTGGTIYRGSLDADVAEVWLPAGADGRMVAQGIEIDDERRLLFVATGPQGTVDAYDIDSKALVGRYDAGLGGYVNDIGVTPAGDVYFTDSVRPNLYRVRATDVRSRTVPEAIAIPQDGPFSYSLTMNGGVEPNALFNAGGVDALDDGTLIVSQINEGRLFRFTVDSGQPGATITEIPVEGAVDNLDALELDGSGGLLVTDNLADEALSLELGPGAATARVESRTSEPNFCTPTGIGLVEGGNRVLVTNAQLFRPTGPPFTITSLPLPLDGTVEDNPDRGAVLTPCARELQAAAARPAPIPAGLRIARARLGGGSLDVRGSISRRAGATPLRVRLRAGGRSRAFAAKPAARSGSVRARLRLRAGSGARAGRLTFRFAGNDRVDPLRVALRAAGTPARLRPERPTVRDGRLRATGRLDPRARGRVRVMLIFRSGGSARSYTAGARVRNGRFALARRLPARVRARLADREGVVRSSVLYPGAGAIAGELEAFKVRGV